MNITQRIAMKLKQQQLKIINNYIKHCGNIRYLSQKSIHLYVENGGDLLDLTDEQIENIPQKSINKYVENGCYDLSDLEDEQIENIPQESINKYVENGGYLSDLTDEQIENIPQESINKYIENKGDISELTNEQIAKIPQESFNKRVENNGNLEGLTKEQIAKIPESIIPKFVVEMSDQAKKSLVLYSIGKIGSDELPDDIYVNYQARGILLSIAKHKLINSFNAICEESGYIDNVPKKVVEAFDSKLKEMKEWVEKKKEEGLKNLLATKETEKNPVKETEKNPAIDKIKGLEW